jgi:hypothetical protein
VFVLDAVFVFVFVFVLDVMFVFGVFVFGWVLVHNTASSSKTQQKAETETTKNTLSCCVRFGDVCECDW